MLLFKNHSTEDLARITANYLPTGKIFGQAKIPTSNLYKYFLGTSKEQGNFIATLNQIYDGMFPKESIALLEYHEKELGIPDSTFNAQGTIEERQIDVIVKKYMMRGNRIQDYLSIAEIYGVQATISTGIQAASFPLKLPASFADDSGKIRHTLYIYLYEVANSTFPLPFPLPFYCQSNISKVKKIYNSIKPVTTKIIYKERA
jgi:hypothetical protein